MFDDLKTAPALIALSLLLCSCVEPDYHTDCSTDAQCPTNMVCRYKNCVEVEGVCQAGFAVCDGECASLETVEHCGSCDGCPQVPRAVATACEDGVCAYACDPGWMDGDGKLAADDPNGCECPPDHGVEICDGLDNDCNGKIDEPDPGLDLEACGDGARQCANGRCLFE